MKKVFLFCTLISSFLLSVAQTSVNQSIKGKKKTSNPKALAQVKLDSLQTVRQLQIDSSVALALSAESKRAENEKMEAIKFQEERSKWLENKSLEADSMHQQMGKMLSSNHEQWLLIERQRSMVNKSAKLNKYEDGQVNYINQTAFERARKINQDPLSSKNGKQIELLKLNDERRSRIRRIVGKAKEQKLERYRKANKNIKDTEAEWIDEVEGYAKN